jgi:hypothetical protein
MKIIFLMLFCLCGVTFAENVLLQSFESSTNQWKARHDSFDPGKMLSNTTEITQDWASHGKRCMKLAFSKYREGQPQWPGVSFLKARGDFSVSDWSDFGEFRIDIKNTGTEKATVSVELRSAPNSNGFTQSINVDPGSQKTLKIDLSKAWAARRNPIDKHNIIKIIIYTTRPQGEIKYCIDNLRLVDNKRELALSKKMARAELALKYLIDSDKRTNLRRKLDLLKNECTGNKPIRQLSQELEGFIFDARTARYLPEYAYNFSSMTDTGNWKNILPSSIYNKKTGYGWIGTPELLCERIEEQKPFMYLNEQQKEFIVSKQPATFQADLTNGKYKVMFIIGYPGKAEDKICPVDMQVKINGHEHRITLAERKIFKTPIFDATVEEGTLNVVFSSNNSHPWIVNALAVWPIQDNELAWNEFIAPIRDHIQILPENERAEWNDTRVVPEIRDNIPKQFHSFGLAPFQTEELVDYSTSYTPASDKYGLNDGISISGARNEIATGTFGLLALANADDKITIKSSDLKSRNFMIPASSVRVRMVENIPYPERKDEEQRIIEHPRFLLDSYEGSWAWRPWEAREFYITIKYSGKVKPGEYKGQLSVSTGNKKAIIIPVVLRVLPFNLFRNNDFAYGAYWYWYVEKNRKRVESEFRNMIDHGFNMIAPWRIPVKANVKNGKIDWEIGQPTPTMKMIQQFNLLRPVPYSMSISSAMEKLHGVKLQKNPVDVSVPAEFYENVTELTRLILLWQKKHNFPEVYFYPLDEIADYNLAVKLAKAIKKVPGAKHFCNSNPIIQKQLGDLVDVNCYSYLKYLSEEELYYLIKSRPGVPAWTYPNETVIGKRISGRMLWGLSGRKIGLQGLWPWSYMSPMGSPNSAFDGNYPDYMLAYPDIDRPIDTVQYEEIRRGIDDSRYYDTALQMIEKLKNSNDLEKRKIAHAAEGDVKSILKEVPFSHREKKSMELGRTHIPIWRNRLVSILEKLNKADRQKQE